MDKEIIRIKNKSYAQVDHMLFTNMEKIQCLDHSLNNLSQFQKFLIAQIQSIQQQNSSNQLTSIDCQKLKQSIIQLSTPQNLLKTKIKELQSTLHSFKKQFIRQKSKINNQLYSYKQDIDKIVVQSQIRTLKQKRELLFQIQKLQKQNEYLHQQNCSLHRLNKEQAIKLKQCCSSQKVDTQLSERQNLPYCITPVLMLSEGNDTFSEGIKFKGFDEMIKYKSISTQREGRRNVLEDIITENIEGYKIRNPQMKSQFIYPQVQKQRIVKKTENISQRKRSESKQKIKIFSRR